MLFNVPLVGDPTSGVVGEVNEQDRRRTRVRGWG